MTNDEVHEQVILWLRGLLGIVVIKDRQQADRPAKPYGMVDLANWGNLDENITKERYEDGLNEAEGPIVKITPEVEREWGFLFFTYGDQPDVHMTRLMSAVLLRQAQEPLLVLGLTVHEVGRANSVPELIGEVWEPRSQVNIIVRGVSSESFDTPVIEQHEFDITGERA